MDETSKQARLPTGTPEGINDVAQRCGHGRTGKTMLPGTPSLGHGIEEEIVNAASRGSPQLLDLGGGDTVLAGIMAALGHSRTQDAVADTSQRASMQGRPLRSRHVVNKLSDGRRPTNGCGGP